MPLRGIKGTYSTAVAEASAMTKKPIKKASAKPSTQKPQETIVPELVEFEELTYDEQRDRLHLERKVERAFYEAGKALQELRDRRLYRSTHPNFESYCLERFGFKRRHPYRLIDAAQVFDNLIEMCPNRTQNENVSEDKLPQVAHAEPGVFSNPRASHSVS
jgi:hypothetical protein